MSKRSLQTFSAGMLLSTSIVAGVYFFSADQGIAEAEKAVMTNEEIQAELKKQGMVQLSAEDYNELLTMKEQVVNSPAPQEEAQEEEETPAPAPRASYTLTIQKGMSTSDVCKILQEAGVIQSARDFNAYLIEAGYHKKVRTGTYELKQGMPFTEISKALTR
ncbi:hypothetical protein GJU40_10815 [Bacillus lacus]|uniref:Aminodeoxychorismate lyase n=1 Tax=Metabacillus lacus TaxID=1983721 RepID=A0A7X2LZ93_9BACI|nr:endolytic transglycosylase MltG [Metabacillus lacus]MRX72638.1 hypothetical protein [Metabacillus lacus]